MADPIHQFAIQKVVDLGDVTLPVLGTVDLAITNSHIAMTVAFVLIVGFLAIVGSLMNSYTADKYDSLMKARFSKGRGVRIGRDGRIFLIFLGALANLPFLTLLVLAILTNVETIRRVVVCYRHESHRSEKGEEPRNGESA